MKHYIISSEEIARLSSPVLEEHVDAYKVGERLAESMDLQEIHLIEGGECPCGGECGGKKESLGMSIS